PAAPDEYELGDLTEEPPVSYEEMVTDLNQLVETIRRPHLKELLARLIHPSTPAGAAYHAAPAAKYYHQAYRHGLLEYCLSVAQGVHALASGPFINGVDRELAVTGAILHDIGKTEVYSTVNGAIELTDHGKLLGEIPLGYYKVRREIERIDGFPESEAEGLLHIILSHHGKLAHGSPVVPCTREATLVHFVDNLGGNLGSFDRIERTLADGASWSDFDRGISTSAFFGPREKARREEAAEPGRLRARDTRIVTPQSRVQQHRSSGRAGVRLAARTGARGGYRRSRRVPALAARTGRPGRPGRLAERLGTAALKGGSAG